MAGAHKAARTSFDGACWAAGARGAAARCGACGSCGAVWDAAAGGPPAAAPAPEPAAAFLDGLPDSVVQHHLLPQLDAPDKRALRAVSPGCRALVNARVRRARLAAADLPAPAGPHAAALAARFPALEAVEAFDCAGGFVTDGALSAWLAGAAPEVLGAIREVNVKRCNYVGRCLLDFLRANCPRLERLAASRWTDSVTLQAVGRTASLAHLDLSDCDALDDGGLAALAPLARLRMLSLARCRWVGDAGCAALAQLTSLEELDLSFTDVSPAGLASLAPLPRLLRLDASNCRRASGGDALAALAGARALASLQLRGGGDGLRGGALGALGALPALVELDLGARFELDDDGAAALAACPGLTRLSVGSFNLTRRPPPAFGGALERLAFGGGYANKGLGLLFPLPRLKSLAASGIDAVNDRVMRTVSSQTSLEELCLRSGYSLTQSGLLPLRSLSNLSALRVSSCPAISDAFVAAVIAAARRSGPPAHGAAAGATAGGCGGSSGASSSLGSSVGVSRAGSLGSEGSAASGAAAAAAAVLCSAA